MDNNWNIRLGLPSDLEFIYATWLNSFWSDSQKYSSVIGPTFFSEYPKIIDHILQSHDTKTYVACSLEDENLIFGYLVAAPPVAHYTFVKSNFRRLGIAKSLIEYSNVGKVYTHRTGELATILHKKEGHTYNPYLLYTKGETHGPVKESAR